VEGESSSSAVADVVAAMHDMLGSGSLLPGHPVRQESVAQALGTSRAAVREALRVLESEGILQYRRNFGYEVKRLTTRELDQTYLMRRVLETELIRALPAVSTESLSTLKKLNKEMKIAAREDDVASLRKLNITFHFTIFELSGLELVVEEVRRIWALSDTYRSVYLYNSAARIQVVREHDAIIDTLAGGDIVSIMRLLDEHRDGLPRKLGSVLAASDSQAPLAAVARVTS
jgi:DNA-binding GntR family transcriptional regulator